SSRRRHTSSKRDWSSDVCSSDLTCRSSPYASETHASSEVPRLDDLGGPGSLLGLLAIELMDVPDHSQPQGPGAEDPHGQLGQGSQRNTSRCDVERSASVHRN